MRIVRVTATVLIAAGLVASCMSSGKSKGSNLETRDKPSTEELFEQAIADFLVSETDESFTIESSQAALEVTYEPFTISISGILGTDNDRAAFTELAGSGLYVKRGDDLSKVVKSTGISRSESGLEISVEFDDGESGLVTVSAGADDTLALKLKADDSEGLTAWGANWATSEDELIYGLTERIVDDHGDSELVPQEVGSLNRKGEKVTMYVVPTMSGYAPFYQSSRGYGLLVDGTMPGTYDLGATDPSIVNFEFEVAPSEMAGSFHLFAGPSHAEILDSYTRLTGRPPLPPGVVFEAWRGRDEYRVGETAVWHDIEINADVARDLSAYDEYEIPVGVFHFDRPWTVGAEGFSEFKFDPQRFPNVAEMLAEMKQSGWAIEVWVSPWAIGGLGDEAKELGYLIPKSPRALDYTNPDAVAWIQDKVVEFLEGPEGQYVDGFFMDRADEPDVMSSDHDIYFDGRTGREIHNAYPVMFDQMMRGALDRARPDGTGWLIARAGYTGSQRYVMRWGGDTSSREGLIIPERPTDSPSTDKGLRSVLISVQRAAFMGTSFWGSDIGGYSQWNDPDLYARWIQVGAVSPLMRFHGQGPAPWDVNPDGTVDEELLAIYKRYVGLRSALRPYLEELADDAHNSGITPVRPLVFTWPDEPGALDRWDQWTLGEELLAAPIWKSGSRTREVWIPPGEWVNFWDRGEVIEGPTTITVDAPIDQLPLFILQGSVLERLPTDF